MNNPLNNSLVIGSIYLKDMSGQTIGALELSSNGEISITLTNYHAYASDFKDDAKLILEAAKLIEKYR